MTRAEAVLTPTGAHCADAWIVTSALIAATRRLKFMVAVPGPGHGRGAVERDDHPAKRDPRWMPWSHHAPVLIDQGELGGGELIAGLAGDDVTGEQVQPLFGGAAPARVSR